MADIKARFVSYPSGERRYKFYITGGLQALSIDGSDNFLYLTPAECGSTTERGFKIEFSFLQEKLKSIKQEIIGLKEISIIDGESHWRWSPHVRRGRVAPENNPAYKWNELSASIERTRGTAYSADIGISAPKEAAKLSDHLANPSDEVLGLLAQQSSCIAIAIHQMNWAIMTIAEHFYSELEASLSHGRAEGTKFSSLRDFDLYAYVHSFFQAYGTARDHYAHFLAIQLDVRFVEKKRRVVKVDSLSALLGEVDPTILRKARMIRLLEQSRLIELSSGDKFRVNKRTWLGYLNFLRNRFVHNSPYGFYECESFSELMRSSDDSIVMTLKRYMSGDEGDASENPKPCDLLRTMNGLYRESLHLFWDAAEFTGLAKPPPTISLIGAKPLDHLS